MKVSMYKKMTFHIFHAINIIKQIKDKPKILPEQEIKFEFKKAGFKKLLIFDLDETLIHCQREELIDNDSEFKFEPEVWINILSPHNTETIKTGFSLRPYALDCLKAAN